MKCLRCGVNVEFKAFAFQRKAYEQEILNNPFVSDALTKDVTLDLIDELKKKLDYGLFNVISVIGEQGLGKTILAFDLISIICEHMKYSFDHRNVGFSYASSIGNIAQAEREGRIKKSAFLTDEQEQEYGIGKQREAMQIRAITNVSRKWQPNLVYVSPDVRKHNHHYLFRVYDFGFVGKERTHTRALVMDANGHYVGFFVGHYPDMFSKDFFDEYDNRKDSFIKNLLGMEGSERYNMRKVWVKRFAADPMFEEIKNQRMKVLYVKSVISGLTEQEYREIVDLVSFEKFKREWNDVTEEDEKT